VRSGHGCALTASIYFASAVAGHGLHAPATLETAVPDRLAGGSHGITARVCHVRRRAERGRGGRCHTRAVRRGARHRGQRRL